MRLNCFNPRSIGWRRVRRNLRDYGFRQTAGKILGSIIRVIFYTRAYTLYRADLGNLALPISMNSRFAFRFLKPDEVHYLAQIQEMEEWLLDGLADILNTGGKCLLALDGERLAGFNLVSFRKIRLPAICFTRRLRPGNAYSEQISIDTAYRGQNLGTSLRVELFRALREQGTRAIYGGSDVKNRANLALCRKVGLRTVADIRHVELLGFKGKQIKRRRS